MARCSVMRIRKNCFWNKDWNCTWMNRNSASTCMIENSIPNDFLAVKFCASNSGYNVKSSCAEQFLTSTVLRRAGRRMLLQCTSSAVNPTEHIFCIFKTRQEGSRTALKDKLRAPKAKCTDGVSPFEANFSKTDFHRNHIATLWNNFSKNAWCFNSFLQSTVHRALEKQRYSSVSSCTLSTNTHHSGTICIRIGGQFFSWQQE